MVTLQKGIGQRAQGFGSSVASVQGCGASFKVVGHYDARQFSPRTPHSAAAQRLWRRAGTADSQATLGRDVY